MNIVLTQPIVNDKFTEYVYDSYDIQDRELSKTTIPNNLNLNFDYNLGVIYGSSGSGKSTLLNTLGEVSEPKFNNTKALISNFDGLEPEQVSMLLASVGLGSVPTWLRTYNTLSNGEQYRANIAKIMSEDGETHLIDEYTSVVDRNVAKSMSNALSKYVRRTNKRLVVATPHEDVIEWLQPDWVYSTETCSLERANYFFRPSIHLEVFRCKYEAWELFKQHHYLTDTLHKSTACFMVTWEKQIVAFLATLDFPGLPQPSKRVTRFVVLPDFQGLGIGNRILNYLAQLYKTAGYTTYIRTVNPALGETLLKNTDWQTKKEVSKRDRKNNDKHTGDKKFLMKYQLNRPSYSCKYIGGGCSDNTDIVTKKNKELDENRKEINKGKDRQSVS